MWSNNNPGGDPRARPDKDRVYEVLHYPAHKPESGSGSNGNRAPDGNKNRYTDAPRYRVVEQVRRIPRPVLKNIELSRSSKFEGSPT
jgi:hypothetical protein